MIESLLDLIDDMIACMEACQGDKDELWRKLDKVKESLKQMG